MRRSAPTAEVADSENRAEPVAISEAAAEDPTVEVDTEATTDRSAEGAD